MTTDGKTTALRERMREDLRLRNYSPLTEKVYIAHVGWYADYFKRSPLRLGLPEARRYLVYLREERKVSLAYFRQAVGALRFFYKYTAGKEWIKERLSYPKLSKNIPVVLTKEEVASLLAAVTDLREKTILSVLYGAGLRLMEALTLEPSDINSKEMYIFVRNGKGRRTRKAHLSPALLEQLRSYYRVYRPTKWLFANGRGGHLGDTFVQRACQQAAQAAGITKRVTPHTLRHSFIMRCRTAELGGHLYRCADCSHVEQSYNSCRNRHCPKCQGSETARWVDARTEELLPVPYFHTVFTLPDALNRLVLLNKRAMYELLFQSVRETLLEVGSNNLGVTLGFFAVLHTWGQLLQLHPHIHCVIPACGITASGEVKVFSQRYLLPDKVLSAVFRGKFILGIKRLYQKQKLQLPDDVPDRDAFERLLSESCASDWVVYSKAPFAGPDVVVKYLARYTHRVAIGNSRLVSIENNRVVFTYRDYADDGARKITSLSADHFLTRFLLHVVPKGFVRIRHYGFLSHSKKRALLAKLRAALLCGTSPKPTSNPHSAPTCPCCGGTTWLVVSLLRHGGTRAPPSAAQP